MKHLNNRYLPDGPNLCLASIGHMTFRQCGAFLIANAWPPSDQGAVYSRACLLVYMNKKKTQPRLTQDVEQDVGNRVPNDCLMIDMNRITSGSVNPGQTNLWKVTLESAQQFNRFEVDEIVMFLPTFCIQWLQCVYRYMYHSLIVTLIAHRNQRKKSCLNMSNPPRSTGRDEI